MSISNKPLPKNINCERYRKHLRAFNSFDKKGFKSVKKVIVSKNICSSIDDKSFSTGVISYHGPSRNKTAKSDLIFDQNMFSDDAFDYCKNCGDTTVSNIEINSKSGRKISKNLAQDESKSKCEEKFLNRPIKGYKNKSSTSKHLKRNREKDPIQQYYRNEKFYQSTDSINYVTDKKISKVSLNPIIEHPEKGSDSKSTIFEIYPENSEEEAGFIDPNDKETIKKLKLFRRNNYFECHSVKSRINSKGSVTSLKDHKCVYRFYLNDRLFPVPLNTDHEENVRCVECCLPLENNNCENSPINGTVQAKVKLDGEIQDMLLMLPVKNSLIVKEWRKISKIKKDYDSLYFGIIKLDLNGDSKFNRNLPSNSLALRYQKGYKELTANKKYEYDSVQDNDIVII